MPSDYSTPSIPLDILSQSREERIQLALEAILGSGTKSNGNPYYSAHQAEKDFGIPRSSLGLRLQGAYKDIFVF
jgi:hypothetical protein